MSVRLSIDLGGTQTRLALISPDGEVLRRAHLLTPTAEPTPKRIIEAVRDWVSESIGPIVFGVPGRVDHLHNKLDHAPNLPDAWRNELDGSKLSAKLGRVCLLVNDADLAAVGEHRYGAGRGSSAMVYLTLSTGVGAGVIVNDRLLVSRWSLAEVGHMVLDLSAYVQGAPATFEELASGTALNRRAKDVGYDSGKALLAALGTEAADRVWAEHLSAVCAGVRNVAYAFSPDRIVIGGGLGLIGNTLIKPIQYHLNTHGPPQISIQVATAALGDDAGLIGGAFYLPAAS